MAMRAHTQTRVPCNQEIGGKRGGGGSIIVRGVLCSLQSLKRVAHSWRPPFSPCLAHHSQRVPIANADVGKIPVWCVEMARHKEFYILWLFFCGGHSTVAMKIDGKQSKQRLPPNRTSTTHHSRVGYGALACWCTHLGQFLSFFF
jgi:hypothetical protein